MLPDLCHSVSNYFVWFGSDKASKGWDGRRARLATADGFILLTNWIAWRDFDSGGVLASSAIL